MSEHNGSWRGAAEDGWLFSRPTGALALVSLTAIFLGCMSLSIGGRNYECKGLSDCSDGGLQEQKGKVHLNQGEDRVVYYPIPYFQPPNLDLCGGSEYCEILEQRDNCFRVRNVCVNGPTTVEWKARGVRAPVATCPGTPPPPTVSPVPAGPPAENHP